MAINHVLRPVIIGAATHLVTRGWYQGGLYDAPVVGASERRLTCPICLVGAVYAAVADGDPMPLPITSAEGRIAETALGEIHRHLGATRPDYPGVIATWQDVPGRTLDEVLDVLEEIAGTSLATLRRIVPEPIP